MVTRSLSSDLKPFNITVISMHPGWVRTGKKIIINGFVTSTEASRMWKRQKTDGERED